MVSSTACCIPEINLYFPYNEKGMCCKIPCKIAKENRSTQNPEMEIVFNHIQTVKG